MLQILRKSIPAKKETPQFFQGNCGYEISNKITSKVTLVQMFVFFLKPYHSEASQFAPEKLPKPLIGKPRLPTTIFQGCLLLNFGPSGGIYTWFIFSGILSGASLTPFTSQESVAKGEGLLRDIWVARAQEKQ